MLQADRNRAKRVYLQLETLESREVPSAAAYSADFGPARVGGNAFAESEIPIVRQVDGNRLSRAGMTTTKAVSGDGGAGNAKPLVVSTSDFGEAGDDVITLAAAKSAAAPGFTNRKLNLNRNLNLNRLANRFAPKAATVTRLTADARSATAGDRVTLTARVTGGPAVAAAGRVTFKVGATVLGVAPVVDGVTALTTADLPVGLSRVVAEYGGDAGRRPSRGEIAVRLTAPSADSRFVSDVLADVAREYGIPGLSAAVINTRSVVTGAAGVRRADESDPVRAGDLFENGSTTKAVTATLAGVLVEKGLIRWDSTIIGVFPELRDVIRPEYSGVTLEALLQHRSGIIADEDAGPELTAAFAALDASDPRAARTSLLPLVLKEPSHPAGEFRYSNSGYAVAGAMLERVGGRSYEELAQRYVFDPLGMKSAVFGPGSSGGPTGHDPNGRPTPPGSAELSTADNPALSPAGSNLRMSVGDWAKFVRAQMGQTVNGVRLPTPATLARLHAPAFPDSPLNEAGVNYASGWETAPAGFAGADPALGAFLNHTGADGYWLAEAQLYPSQSFAVLIMANAESGAGGQDLGAAFSDIKTRLTERFAPSTRP